MDRYVQRDSVTGEVTGHFALPQSYATEKLPNDHPDLQAYRARREVERQQVSPFKALEERVRQLEALLK